MMTELVWLVLSAAAMGMAIATNRAEHHYQAAYNRLAAQLTDATAKRLLTWHLTALTFALIGLVFMFAVLLAMLLAKGTRYIVIELSASALCYALAWEILTKMTEKVAKQK